MRIGIDVGGTFTDFVAIRGAELVHLKEPSTPDDPAAAVISGLERLIERLEARATDVSAIAHGTTIGLNAIIQRRGAPLALVISRGHRDVLELTRRLPKEYDLRQPRVQPLVPRDRVIEIDARLDANGRAVAHPDDAEIARVADRVRESGVSSVAVAVLHSYLDPGFEMGIAERLSRELPGLSVTSSAAIWPEIREYNRASAVALNAYIAPLMREYLAGLERRLAELGIAAPLYITASNGGSIGVETARQRPIDTILSGPASGVTASVQLGARNGIENLISFDMGGTSSDIAVAVTGGAEFANRTEVGGLPLILPVVDVNAIGAGGGSIARLDDQGALHVGPESAGAVPGPAAYGLGATRPTVTDAYLATGIIAPERFLGGEQRLDLGAAHRSLRQLARSLGHTGDDATTRAAADVLTVATVGMAAELQKVLARRGFEAAEFTLIPFGGAGPTHAALLADETGISSIVVPLSAGTYCALGAVGAPLRRDYLRGIGRLLDDSTAAVALEHLDELLETGRRWADEQGGARSVDIRCSLEMRYVGQAFELEIPVAAHELPLEASDIAERFHARHEDEFGHRDTASGIVLVSARATVVGDVPPVPAGVLPDAAPDQVSQTRPVFISGEWRDARILTADKLWVGLRVPGPAVIDLPHTTVLVPPNWTLTAAVGDTVRLDRNIDTEEGRA